MIGPLTHAQRVAAYDRASLRRTRRNRDKASLSPGDVDLRIESAIIEAAIARGTVTEADLFRANVPREAITEGRFTRCFDAARLRDPAIGHVESGA